MLASVLSVLAFDFFFVPPYLTFAVSDTQYLVTFAVMLVVGLVISNLAAALRTQARIAGYRETRTAALYAMSRELGRRWSSRARCSRPRSRTWPRCSRHAWCCCFPDRHGRIERPAGASRPASLRGADVAVAQWVLDHGERAGLGTDTLPSATAHYVPLPGSRGNIGVLALEPSNPRRLFIPEQQRLLETFASQIALALERARLAAEARASQVRRRVRARCATRCSRAISHDLRTPLAVDHGRLDACSQRMASASSPRSAPSWSARSATKPSAWPSSSTTCSTWRGCSRAP